jgi:hypothetical protein
LHLAAAPRVRNYWDVTPGSDAAFQGGALHYLNMMNRSNDNKNALKNAFYTDALLPHLYPNQLIGKSKMVNKIQIMIKERFNSGSNHSYGIN